MKTLTREPTLRETIDSLEPSMFRRFLLAVEREKLTGRSRRPLLTDRERAQVDAATRYERVRNVVTIDRRRLNGDVN
jgi:hypothetical protein